MKKRQRVQGPHPVIFGPTVQEQKYIRCAEHFKLRATFVSSEEKFARIERMCKSCDGILFVIPNASHAASYIANRLERKTGMPVVRVRSSGTKSVREGIAKLIPRMLAYRGATKGGRPAPACG